ncbi:RAB6A-GEF complex partner protein 2 isoform X1 [Drosophila pseudoobscura]|uniref:RAB6A-GEF complex partner protein 2 isoform X1 n=1 Tax=Drosophila pseudoobscura pseudoobscura TaxID=46245 RepID=A0A6I8W5V8_DROPS|nr:RAB6A-GEF complex partner protein 2 isoform X1 [Drosophila pseudoobscura]
MIEIKAKLVRADSAIYATGERVECLIEFTHKVFADEQPPSNRNANEAGYEFQPMTRISLLNSIFYSLENLAWASAQLHCYRKTSYSTPAADKTQELTELIGRTALDAVTQAPGEVIVATKPKILFCDLKLQPGETKIYFFNEFVPRDGPPTYRGHDIRYFYKITIATQRVKSKVQTLTVPIRVLPIPIIARPDELPVTVETNEELAPTNPFLEKREISELEISWHHLKNVTARRAPKFYRISNKRGFVGRFCLFKPAYKLGEDIVGSLDFDGCQVRCVQFSVKLQQQELPIRPQPAQALSQSQSSVGDDASSIQSFDMASIASGVAVDSMHRSATSGSAREDTPAPTGKLSTIATTHQVCYATLQTQVVVPIPLHVTPTFRTDLVDVKWRLHFEFVTSTMMDFGGPNPESGELKAPAEMPVETMVWNLPVTIYAANPLQIYNPNQTFNLLIK